MKRLFIAIETPDEFRSWLAEQYRQITSRAPEWASSGSPFRGTASTNYHVTIHFLGDTPEGDVDRIVAKMQDVCRPLPHIHLSAGAFGCFPSLQRPRVLWLGVSGSDLELISLTTAFERIESMIEELGFPRESREFHPHITVAYAKRSARPEALRKAATALTSARVGSGPGITARGLTLFESLLEPSGARHVVRFRAPFEGD